MGSEWMTKAITALRQAGIRTGRGYPSGKMPYLRGPVAAVILQQSKVSGEKIEVQIFSPMNQGGTACEDAAFQAADALRQLGGFCTIGECGFDGEMGLFHQTVTVNFLLIQSETPTE